MTKVSDLRSYKLIVIDYPYFNWGDLNIQQTFCKAIKLRLAGYKENHFKGVMPFDSSDLASSHYLWCVKGMGNVYEPILGYRSIALSRAEQHRIPFGPVLLAQSCGGGDHVKALNTIIDRCKTEKKDVYYGSTYTIDPVAKADPIIGPTLHEAIIAMHTLEHLNQSPRELITAGNCRFKMEKFFKLYGYELLKLNGKELGTLSMPHYDGDEMQLFQMEKFSQYALDIAAKWKQNWDERIIIDAGEGAVKKAA